MLQASASGPLRNRVRQFMVKKRTVPTLGRLDQVDHQLHAVISGLMKVSGQTPDAMPVPTSPPSITFESARALGNVWALTELWKELGFDTLNLFPGELVDVYIGKK